MISGFCVLIGSLLVCVCSVCWWVSCSSWSPSVQTWTQKWQQFSVHLDHHGLSLGREVQVQKLYLSNMLENVL